MSVVCAMAIWWPPKAFLTISRPLDREAYRKLWGLDCRHFNVRTGDQNKDNKIAN
jgi:hypothetical protein